MIRAEKLRDMGLIDVLEVERLSPEELSSWMARELPTKHAAAQLNLNGLDRIPEFAAQVLGLAPQPPLILQAATAVGEPALVVQ